MDDDVVAIAQRAAKVAATHAREVDAGGVFPQAAIEEFRRTGLFGLIVPAKFGGLGKSYSCAVEVAQILGAACLSSSMLWSMHCQQAAVLIDHAPEHLQGPLLRRVAAGELLLASVTSEPAKGGHLLSALAALETVGDQLRIDREAPVVTGGLQADGMLVTMRRSPEATPVDIVLVFVNRGELIVTETGRWDTTGVRGTSSAAIHIDGSVPADRVIDPEGGFRRLAITTMIPVGHLMWTACWLGAAKEAYRQMMHVLRSPDLRVGYPLKSDLYAERIARVRLEIDLVDALLGKVTAEYEALKAVHGTSAQPFEDYGFNIRLNELKVAAGENLFDAVNRIVQIVGLRHGYRRDGVMTIERIFRDIRSASLMFSDDRLLVSNGKLAMLDTSLWRNL